VVREGIETALFLFAATAEDRQGCTHFGGYWAGHSHGNWHWNLQGASRLNLRSFFTVTSLLLILFEPGYWYMDRRAAEAGAIPPLVERVWTAAVSCLRNPPSSIPDRNFRLQRKPIAVEVIAYFGYLGLALAGYFYPRTKRGGIFQSGQTSAHRDTAAEDGGVVVAHHGAGSRNVRVTFGLDSLCDLEASADLLVL